MGTVRYLDGNNQTELRGDIEDYLVTGMTAGAMVLEYDDSIDPLPGQWPDRVEFIVADGVLETWEGGPNDGQPHYTGGTLTGVNLYDGTGKKVMSITGLDLSMAYVASTIEWDSGWSAVNHILAGGHVFIGSNAAVDGDPFDGDRINTGFGDDIARGRDGDDYFDDVGGRDLYNGGDGIDWVGYTNHRWAHEAADSGIVARLDQGYVIGTDGLRDTIRKIEGIQGSMFDDRMIGDSGDNRFEGMAGDDFINGRGGWDRVQYDNNDWVGGVGGIRVNLAKETARDDFGNRDTLRNIEEVRGTDQNDRFVDDRKDNWFEGRDGDDVFVFGKGNDGASGGAGADKFVFRGNDFGFNSIEDFEDGIDRIKIANAPDFAALTVTQDGTDTLVQWNGNEVRLDNVTATDITGDDFIF